MQDLFRNKGEYVLLCELLEAWSDDSRRVKEAFLRLRNTLSRLPRVSLSFHSRPGVSHSFRTSRLNSSQGEGRLIGLVDIVDDDPENRWLSVCFYSNLVSDPDEAGNLLPGGLLEEDGYCFDLFEYEDRLLTYLEERVVESFRNSKTVLS